MTKRPHEETTATCMVIVKGGYAVDELESLASKLESNTFDELARWISGLQEKPLILLRTITMIDRIAKGHGHSTEFIFRRVAEACRKTIKFETKIIPEWEQNNGGQGAYAKAAIAKIKQELQKVES